MRYDIYGLRVASELSFPELPESFDETGACSEPDVVIRHGEVPPALHGATMNAENYYVLRNRALFSIPGVGRFLAIDGREIVVEPAPGADPGDLRLFALGSGMGAILHQRNACPLHASAVTHNGRCYAFLGTSGAGKSTIASLLNKRGFEIVSDDILLVGKAGPDEPTMVATPGIPIFKLWPESAVISGFAEPDAEFESGNMPKYRIPAADAFTDTRSVVSRLYALHWDEDPANPPVCTRRKGVEAVQLLRQNVYRGSLLTSMDREVVFFELAHRLLKQAPLYEFRRAKSFDRIEQQLDHIERHIRHG